MAFYFELRYCFAPGARSAWLAGGSTASATQREPPRRHLGRGHLAGRYCRAVERGDHAEFVRFDPPGRNVGPDSRKGRIDAIEAGREHRRLAALLSSRGEKLPRVLEVVAGDGGAQDAIHRDRVALAGIHQAEESGGHDNSRNFVDPVDPRPVPAMESRRECIGLNSRLSMQGDNAPVGQAGAAQSELLHNNPNLGFPDAHQAQQGLGAKQQDD